MDAAWRRLTDCAPRQAHDLTVLGRKLAVPQAARGVARFDFAGSVRAPLAAADYLAVAREFSHRPDDHIPLLTPENAQ